MLAAMVAILKICFSLLLLNQKANWLETWLEESGWLVAQNKLKSFRSEIQDGRSSWKSIFSILLLNWWNLVGSNKVACRSKKSFRSEIQDGSHGRHLENLFFTSPEPKDQLTWNLVGSIKVTCRSKLAKIIQIWNPRWQPWPPSWKSIFRFFFWTE